MGLAPVAAGSVTEETAPFLVEDLAVGHELQRLAGHVKEVRIARLAVRVEKEVVGICVRELGRLTKAAEDGVVIGRDVLENDVEDRGR